MWYTVASAVNVTRNTFVKQLECWAPGSENTLHGKHPNFAIQEHTSSTSHQYTLNDTKILVKEDRWFLRKIWEALHIHKRSPTINLDRGHEIPLILLQLLSRDPHHSTIKKVQVTWMKRLVCFNLVSERYIHFYIMNPETNNIHDNKTCVISTGWQWMVCL